MVEGSCVSAQNFGVRVVRPTQPVHPQSLVLGPAQDWRKSDPLRIHYRFDLLTDSKSRHPDEVGRLCYLR